MELLIRLQQYAESHQNQLAINTEKGALTYGELWQESGKLAAEIENILGSNKNPIVVYGHKSPNIIMFFLACVRSGRAYCPVDTSVPEDRISDIVEKTDCRLILDATALDEKNSIIESISDTNSNCRIITAEQAKLITNNSKKSIDQDSALSEDDTFYIIFTSGSTGKPKGVCISAKNLDTFLRWSACLGDDPKEKEKKVFLNQAPFSFDLSVMDLYTSLWSGGTLCTVNKETQSNIGNLMERLAKGQINYWVSTPSFANMCCSEPAFNGELLPELRAFLFCGETLTNAIAKKLKEKFPKAKIINTYGPTETTVAVTSVEITSELIASQEALPVGAPGAETEIEIVDETGKILPQGKAGEIVIKGATVSKGYFKDAKQTAKVFDCGNKPAYHTGDKGFFRDGQLHFCGRMDLQVKYHGYRIELGDIENNLLLIPQISEAAVLPKRKDGAIKNLVAVVSGMGIPENQFSEGKKIKAALKEKLPEYMIPKKIIFVDIMSVTANGKADRKALKEIIG